MKQYQGIRRVVTRICSYLDYCDGERDFAKKLSDRLPLTFGGMWRWRRVAVARVFALVVRCRVMRLLLFSRVGKNRDTGGSPRRCRGGLCRCTPNDPLWLEISRGTEGNAIYRPVSNSYFFKVNPTGTLRTSASYILM